MLLITEDNNLCGVVAPAAAAPTSRMDLHAIYSTCLTDPALAAQLKGRSDRTEHDTVAEDSIGRWTR